MSRALLYVAYPMRLDLGAANAIQTYNTVRELRKLVPDIHLVVPRWLREPSAFADLGAQHLPRPAVNKLSRLVPWSGWSYIERTLYSLMLAALLVAWRLRGRGYRTLYVRDVVCAAWLCLLGPLHGGNVIYEVHDLESEHPTRAARWPEPFWKWFLPRLDRVALTKSCRLVSLTGAFRTWAARFNLRLPDEIVVVPDAFDPEIYHPSDRAAARKQLGISDDAFVVAYSGLTFAYRRLDLLVDAFAKLLKMGDNSLLILVGGRASEVAELRAQARKLGIPTEKIVLPGPLPQPETAAYLAAADALVIPDTVTQMTASPLKLFEYIAMGRPVVLKDMPALREILDDSAALYFEGGEADALAAALQRLRLDPALGEQLGQAALTAAPRYTYEARAQKIAKLVQSCS